MATVHPPEPAHQDRPEPHDVDVAPAPTPEGAGGFWDAAIAYVLLFGVLVAAAALALWLL